MEKSVLLAFNVIYLTSLFTTQMNQFSSSECRNQNFLVGKIVKSSDEGRRLRVSLLILSK